MIYEERDCDRIKCICDRKLLERSIYSSMDTLSLAFRSSMDCQLELDIKKCEAM